MGSSRGKSWKKNTIYFGLLFPPYLCIRSIPKKFCNTLQYKNPLFSLWSQLAVVPLRVFLCVISGAFVAHSHICNVCIWARCPPLRIFLFLKIQNQKIPGSFFLLCPGGGWWDRLAVAPVALPSPTPLFFIRAPEKWLYLWKVDIPPICCLSPFLSQLYPIL